MNPAQHRPAIARAGEAQPSTAARAIAETAPPRALFRRPRAERCRAVSAPAATASAQVARADRSPASPLAGGHRLRQLVVVLTTTSLAIAGCSGSPVPDGPSTPSRSPVGAASPAPPAVVDGIGLAILQNRPDYATRVLQLSVTNEGADPVTVVGARFESAQFSEPASWTKAASTEVPAGLTRSLPVQLPPAVCPTPDTATPTLTLTLADASGATREVAGEPSDPFGVLARIGAEDCLDEAVGEVAALSLDDALEVTGTGADTVAHLTLRVDPSGGTGGLHLDEARFTILLAPAEGSTWPLDATVHGGDAPREFTLDAVPARCDPHAIAEDKRGTFLPVVLEVDDGPSGTVSVPSSDALRLALYDFIAAHCGHPAIPSTPAA